MPIWLRRFTHSKISEHYKQENEAYENAKNDKGKKSMINSDGSINTPEFLKASKTYKKQSNYK